MFVIALATRTRHGPDCASAKWRWVSPVAVLAVVTGVIMSGVCRDYVVNFGRYTETYGSLGAVIGVLLWLYLTAMAVIVGAEVNDEIEHRTRVDSNAGELQAMGHRNAEMVDNRPSRHLSSTPIAAGFTPHADRTTRIGPRTSRIGTSARAPAQSI